MGGLIEGTRLVWRGELESANRSDRHNQLDGTSA